MPISHLPRLLIDGIPPETSPKSLAEHFSQYGKVVGTEIYSSQKVTYLGRDYAFVSFENLAMAERALQTKEHVIHNKKVEVKETPPEEQIQTNQNQKASCNKSGHSSSNKIFVGGLPDSLTEEEFYAYFDKYGQVSDSVLIYNKETRRPRGFGFVEFYSQDSATNVLKQQFHTLKGKKVEVKKAVPKDILGTSTGMDTGTVVPDGSGIGMWHYYNAFGHLIPSHYNYNHFNYAYHHPQFYLFPRSLNANGYIANGWVEKNEPVCVYGSKNVKTRSSSSRSGAPKSLGTSTIPCEPGVRAPELDDEVLKDCDSHFATTIHVPERHVGPEVHNPRPADNLHECSKDKNSGA